METVYWVDYVDVGEEVMCSSLSALMLTRSQDPLLSEYLLDYMPLVSSTDNIFNM